MTLPYRVRQVLGFLYRDWSITRREWSWVVVFTFYALVNAASIALIGVAANDEALTLRLVVGVLLWSFLSVLFSEIALSIAWERWDGTLEFTFMAPAPRVVHLLGVSLYALTYSAARLVLVLLGLLAFVPVDLSLVNLPGLLLVLAAGSFAFIGLGLMAATLPVLSPSRGAEATNIFQGVLLLVSGIYYPVAVLPVWLQPLAWLSPATYALRASRVLLGLDEYEQRGNRLVGGSVAAILPDLGILLAMGAVLLPLGLWVFRLVEMWAKRTGRLKRTG